MGKFNNNRRGGFGGGNRRFDRDGDDGGRGRFGGGRNDFNRGPPRMFNSICANCNEKCQVPFKPDGSKPVLCSNCFRNKSSNLNPGQSNLSSNGISQDQFKSLNAKLDKIILILQQLELDTEELEEEEGEEGDVIDEEGEEFEEEKEEPIDEEEFDISKDK